MRGRSELDKGAEAPGSVGGWRQRVHRSETDVEVEARGLVQVGGGGVDARGRLHAGPRLDAGASGGWPRAAWVLYARMKKREAFIFTKNDIVNSCILYSVIVPFYGIDGKEPTPEGNIGISNGAGGEKQWCTYWWT